MVASLAVPGYPFFFPTLFGSGADGEVTLTTNSDVGYLGSYGAKQAVNATLAAGQTLTLGQGTSSGALMIACRGKLSIAGTITADGAAGSNAAASGTTGGAGGGTAGGGAGASTVSTDANGALGTAATKIGHGAASKSNLLAVGGSSGGHHSGTSTAAGGNVNVPGLSTSTTYSGLAASQRRLIHPASTIGGVMMDPFGLSAITGTASTNGTSIAVNPTTGDVGPWAQTASGLFLPLGYIPPGPGGFGGGITNDGSGNDAGGGGGGGGGGVIIFEANTIELVAGYSITARGGLGGNGTTQGGTSTAQAGQGGWGGLVLLICRNLIGSTAAINCNAGSNGTGAGAGVGTPPSAVAGGFYVIKV